MMVEINKDFSISAEAVEYYANVIDKILIPRVVQAHIQVMEDCGPMYKHYPDIVK